MAYDTAQLTYTLGSTWPPQTPGSALIPWFDDTAASPQIFNDYNRWLSTSAENVLPYNLRDLLVQVKRPANNSAQGVRIQIQVLTSDADPTPLLIRGIVIRAQVPRDISVYTSFVATLSDDQKSLFLQDDCPSGPGPVLYNFDILLADRAGNLGVLDPRLVNAS